MDKEENNETVVVLYKTFFSNIPLWKSFTDNDKLNNFIHSINKVSESMSIDPYYKIVYIKPFIENHNISSKDVEAKNEEKEDAKVLSENKNSNPNKDNDTDKNDTTDKENNDQMVKQKSKPKDHTLKYESNAELTDEVKTLPNGKSYSYSTGYGELDEASNKTKKFEIDYKLSKKGKPIASYIHSVSNKNAINDVKGIIMTNRRVSLYLYNLDNKGQKTNLLYYYEFNGLKTK